MWNKLTQVAGLSSSDADVMEDDTVGPDTDQQLDQEKLIQQLKELLRENDKKLQDKEKELQDNTAKFQKFKLQSKAKISHLTSQIKEQDKPKKDDCDFDDTSSSDSSDQIRRGKVLLLKKQLEQAKQQIEKKDAEVNNMCKQYEKRVTDLEAELTEKNTLISTIADKNFQEQKRQDIPDGSPKKEGSNVQEMYAQIVYKDSKILELNNQILEHEKRIMDLQETIREKDEVLQQRNRAVQLIAEDLNRKGMTVVNELDETRDQMKIMQENFAEVESKWKKEFELMNAKINGLEEETSEKDKKIKVNEETMKKLESMHHELSFQNAELQKKVTLAQENAAKQCEMYQKEVEIELDAVKKDLDLEKSRTADLQKHLDEMTTQSENKILKARAKERSKFKALEREMESLKKTKEEKPKEILELQQQIAELEEEKGSLQLKLMETEEHISIHDNMVKNCDALKKTVAEAEDKINASEKQMDCLESEKHVWETKFQSLSEEFSQLQLNFNHISQQNHEANVKLSELIKIRRSLEKDHESLGKENIMIKNLCHETNKELEALKDEKVTFELKVIELEEMRERDEKAKNELISKVEMLKESLNNEKSPILKLQNEKLELEQKLQEMTDHHKLSQAHSEELLEQINSLKDELENSKHNYSQIFESKIEVDERHSIILDKLKEQESINESLLKSFEENNVKFQEKKNELEMLHENLSTIENEMQQIFDASDVTNVKDFVAKWTDVIATNERLTNDFFKVKEEMTGQIQMKEKDMHNFNTYIDELKSSLSQQEHKIAELNDLLVLKEKSVKKYENKISESEEINKSLSSDIEKQSSTLIELKEENCFLIREIDSLKSSKSMEKEKFESKVSSLLGQIEDLESEVSHLQNDTENKLKEAEHLHRQISLFQEDKENNAEDLEKSQNICKDLELKMEDYNCKYSILQKENEELIVQVAKKETEINNLTISVNKFQLIAQTSHEKISAISEKLLSVETEITLKDKQLHSLEAQNAMLQEQITHFNLSLPEKEEMCTKILDEKQVLEAQLIKLNQEAEALKLSLTNVNTDYSSCKSLNAELKVEIQDWENKYLTLQDMLDEIRNENKCLKQASEMQILKLEASENETRDLISQNSTLNEKIIDQSNAMDDLQKSYGILNENNTMNMSTLQQLGDMKGNLETLENEVAFLKKEKVSIEDKYNELTIEFNFVNEKNKSVTECLETLKKDSLLQIASLKDEIATVLENELKAKSEVETLKHNNAELSKQYQEVLVVNKDRMDHFQQTILTLNEKLGNYETEVSILHQDKQISSQKLEQMVDLNNKLDTVLNKNMSLQLSNDELDKALQLSEQEKQEAMDKSASSEAALHQEIKELNCKLLKKEQEVQNMNFILMQERSKYETELVACNVGNVKHLNNRYCKFMIGVINSLGVMDSTAGLEHFVQNSECKSFEEFLSKVLKDANTLAKCILDSRAEIEILNQEIDTNENDIKLLHLQLDTLKADLKACQLENQSLKLNLNKLKNVISNSSCSVFEAIRSLEEKLLLDLQSKIKTIDSMENSFTKLKNSFVSCRNELTSVKADKKDLHKEMEILKKESSEMQLNSKCTEEENSRLILQCRELNAQLQNSSENISLLQSSCADNVKEISEKLANSCSELQLLQHELHDKNGELVSAKEGFKTLTEDNLNLKDNVDNLNLKVIQLKSLIEEREKEISAKHSELEFIRNKSSAVNLSHNELAQKNVELQLQIEACMERQQNFEDQVAQLTSILNEKDDALSKLIQDQQNNDNALQCLRMELENVESSFKESQNEIINLKKQRNEYLEQLQTLETSHNVSNVMQEEVENLQKELSLCEERNNSLQQHLENMNSQLISSAQEKQFLEATIADLQRQSNDLKDEKTNFSNSIEEMKSLLHKKESEHQLSVNQYLLDSERFHQELDDAKQEREKLLSEKIHFVPKLDFDLRENELILLKDSLGKFQFVIKDLKDCISTIIDHNSYNCVIKSPDDYDISDDNLKQVIIEFQDVLSRVIYVKQNYEELNDSLKAMSSENQLLLQEVECLKNPLKILDQSKEEKVQLNETEENKEIVPMSDTVLKIENEILCQSSNDIMTENESLKQELHSTKLRGAKMLTKLKLFKEKTEKLQNELKDLKDHSKLDAVMEEKKELEKKNSQANETYNKLLQKYQFSEQQHQLEVVKSDNIMAQIKERYNLMEDDLMKTRQELQQYRESWNESMVSFELQKEDNVRLEDKLKELTEELKSMTANFKEHEIKLIQAEKETFHQRQELQSMRDQANMLLSDNETYQDLIEKLKSSKILLESRYQEAKERYAQEIKSVEKRLQLEIDRVNAEKRSTKEETVSDLEKECFSLTDTCRALQGSNHFLQKEVEALQSEVKSLKQDKLFTQQQLLRQNSEIKILSEHSENPLRSFVDEAVQCSNAVDGLNMEFQVSESENRQSSEVSLRELKDENQVLKSQLGDSAQQLHLLNSTLDVLKQQDINKDVLHKEEILKLREQIKLNEADVAENLSDIHQEKESLKAQDFEIELQQAMSSLHRQGLRCEELSNEVSKLLEERNTLRWKLQQQSSDYKKLLQNEGNVITSEINQFSSSERIEIPVQSGSMIEQSSSTSYQEQLVESIKTCQELHRVNEALDLALRSEQDQKRNIEEELLWAKEQLMQQGISSPKDEFRLLLGDVEEPEMLTETNFSISRKVKSHTYKIQRWIKGRQNYLSRMLKSRNYSQLVYICYICILHIWLVACVFT